MCRVIAVTACLEQPCWAQPPLDMGGEHSPPCRRALMGQDVDILVQAQQDADLFGKVQWLKYFCAASGIHGRRIKIFHYGWRRGIFLLEDAAPEICASAQPIQQRASQDQQAGQAGTDLPFQAHSSQEGFSPEELAGPNHRSLIRMWIYQLLCLHAIPVGWLFTATFGCRAVLPQTWEIFCSHISAAPEILKAAATYPSSCPLFSRISNRRRGVSFCQALQLPGMLPRCHHLIQRQPEQLLRQPGQGQALSLLTHPSTKLCTAQPQPFPASP